MPHVATSPADLLSAIRAAAHLDGDLLRHRRRGGVPRRPRSATSPGRPRSHGRPDDRRRPVARLGGEPGARRPVGEHPGPVRRPRSWRGLGLHRAGHQHPRADVRHGPDRLRDGRGRRRRGGHPRARPERADLHVPAPDRLLDRRAGRARSRPAGGGPVFIQGDHYQFNAKKYAADPEAMTEEIRRACRLAVEAGYRNIDIDSLDAGRPLEADGGRAAARELRPGGRADRADPDARDGRGDDQRRRRDRRGRQAELDRRGAARLPRRLSARARRAARRAPSASARSASRPAPATAACRCPTAASPRSSSTSRCCASSARSPASYGLAGAVQHGASTLPDELFHRFPAVETAEIHLATGFQNAPVRAPGVPRGAPPRDRGLVLRERRRRAQGRPDRPAVRLHDAQEGDRPVQAPAVGPPDEGRDPRGASGARSRSCSRSSASTGRARWSRRTSGP